MPSSEASSSGPSAGPGSVHRLGDLLGAVVVLADGRQVGHVNDVRLAGRPYLQDYVVEGIVVGRRAEGSLLGYDRREVQGPWLVRRVVAWTNRGAGYVPWRAVRRIDWEGPRVVVDRVDPLTVERPGH